LFDPEVPYMIIPWSLAVAIITGRSRISTFYWNQEKRIVQRLEED
jgi:hypothetical protein